MKDKYPFPALSVMAMAPAQMQGFGEMACEDRAFGTGGHRECLLSWPPAVQSGLRRAQIRGFTWLNTLGMRAGGAGQAQHPAGDSVTAMEPEWA